MTGQIVVRSSPVALIRRKTLTPARSPTESQPTLSPKPSSNNVGELAGGTAANCVVVCCCCPCVLVEFLFLAVYKVPATVLRRIYRKRRKKIIAKKKKKILTKQATVIGDQEGGSSVGEVTEVQVHHHQKNYKNNNGKNHLHHPSYCDELSDVEFNEFEKVKISIDGSADAVELDRQMWDQFQNSGFWRSPSQRHT